MTDHEIKSSMAEFALARNIHTLPNGSTRVETALQYPDGGQIDVFVVPNDHLSLTCLSDKAQTTAWLLDLQIKPWESEKHRRLQSDVLHGAKCELQGGEITTSVREGEELGDAVLRLAQACLRTADLMFTREWEYDRLLLATRILAGVEGIPDGFHRGDCDDAMRSMLMEHGWERGGERYGGEEHWARRGLSVDLFPIDVANIISVDLSPAEALAKIMERSKL